MSHDQYSLLNKIVKHLLKKEKERVCAMLNTSRESVKINEKNKKTDEKISKKNRQEI